MSDNHRTPAAWFFGTAQAPRLYAIEERRSQLMRKCAKVWITAWNECFAKRMEGVEPIDESDSDFWGVAMPQVLFDTLESYAPSVARRAAVAWLQYDTDEIKCGRRNYDGDPVNPFLTSDAEDPTAPDIGDPARSIPPRYTDRPRDGQPDGPKRT